MKEKKSTPLTVTLIFIIFAGFKIASAGCVSNGSNLTENGSWCANMNNYNYCSNYSGCEWIDTDAANISSDVNISSTCQCHFNESNPTEDRNRCANTSN